ncbi:hypothetical protein [Mycobacterium sp. JS623]|uniref:hypothetical protein n=1 Tax=Mycobacterium sp. JS623 TaxID=212767 RepID=UPI0012F8B9B3|nr:hypothetical protein [Mycobacterium sp. JS623]
MSMRDPWVLLWSIFDGAMTWACGVPIPLAAASAAVTLGTAAGFTALGTKYRKTPARTLRVGTGQHRLIDLLDGHVRSLQALQRNGLPVVAQPKAQDALGAADAARPSLLKMAGAVDTLDEAISAARKVTGQGEHAAETINNTVGRLTERRAKLIGKLTAAVDEVATVYAGLLELSATALTMDVSLDDEDLGAINDSVTVLQMTLAELEADATKLSNEALRQASA